MQFSTGLAKAVGMGDTTVAERVATVLVELGVERVYGLPGEDHMTLLDALGAAGVDYRAAFNESSAVVMAATEARCTGKVGVTLLSLAPGVSNGMNGIVHAYLDALPVLVLSGQHASSRLPFVVRQGFDVEQMVRPATKWTARLPLDVDPARLLCKAVDVATSGTPGPVYLEIPDEAATKPLADADGQPSVDLLARELRSTSGGSQVMPSADVLDGLLGQLAAAKRPVLVLGGRQHRVSPEAAAAFADAVRCPVFLTSAQKGVLGPDDPWFAGTFLGGNVEQRVLGEADLILAVNLEGYDVYNKPWPYEAPTFAIAGEPSTEWLVPYRQRVTADPDLLLRELARGLDDGSSAWRAEDVTSYRDGLRADLLAPAEGGLTVAAAVDAVLAECGPETVVVADAGFSKPLVALLSDIARPGHYLASNGLSTMGFAVPAGTAAAYATGRPVVGFLGDGSLLMRATELALTRGLDPPPVFVAVMDGSLSQIEIKQDRRGLARVGVALPEIRCEDLARTLGIRGVDVSRAEDVAGAISAARADGEPLLLGVHVDAATSPATFELLRG